MLLSKEVFSSVVQNTPLVSIDLVIYNKEGKILLGKRVNEPAKNFWFVPGGRVFKDESLDEAFTRTTTAEIGLELKREDSEFHGLYEHFYINNVFNDAFSTHYIVLAHKITVDDTLKLYNQHSEYKWFSQDELLNSKDVHKYTKDYFMEIKND
jgi:colanic acid biosynthesis protein WcaH